MTRDALYDPAVVAPESPVNLVENSICTAVQTSTLPITVLAVQYWRVAPAVQQDERLFAPLNPRFNRL